MKYGTYVNGNYFVSIDSYGNKTRRTFRRGEEFNPEFPEGIDLKITNKCSHGCPFCHESSIPEGKSFDLEKTKEILSNLPHAPIELAVGGGNVLEIKKDLLKFLTWAKDYGFRTAITLKEEDALNDEFIRNIKLLEAVDAIGISRMSYKDPDSQNHYYPGYTIVVNHIIPGVFPIEDFDTLLENEERILILGYKTFGRGINYKPKNLEEWKDKIKKTLWNLRNSGGDYKIGFDNLAIEQLGIKDSLLDDEWLKSYMGDEFSCTMYIDAVEGILGHASHIEEGRQSWDDENILDYFKKNKKIYDSTSK